MLIRIQYPSSGNRNPPTVASPIYSFGRELLLFTNLDLVVGDRSIELWKMTLLQLCLLRCFAIETFYNQNIHLEVYSPLFRPNVDSTQPQSVIVSFYVCGLRWLCWQLFQKITLIIKCSFFIYLNSKIKLEIVLPSSGYITHCKQLPANGCTLLWAS